MERFFFFFLVFKGTQHVFRTIWTFESRENATVSGAMFAEQCVSGVKNKDGVCGKTTNIRQASARFCMIFTGKDANIKAYKN